MFVCFVVFVFGVPVFRAFFVFGFALWFLFVLLFLVGFLIFSSVDVALCSVCHTTED